MIELTSAIIESSMYKEIDTRVIDFLDKTITSLQQNNIEVNDYTELILGMILNQSILYYKALDEINDTKSVSSTDSYSRKAKMPAISIMQTAHDKILILLDKILASPIAAAKVSKLREKTTKETSVAELIAAITA